MEPPAQLNSHKGWTVRKSPLTVWKNPSKILSTQAITKFIKSIYNVTTYLTLSQWPWNYCGHPNIVVVLNWGWSVFRNFFFAWRFQKVTGQERKTYQVKKFLWSRPQECGAVCRGCCFSLPLLMNAEVICLSEEESRGEAWFPLHFICAPQPLPVSPLCFHMLGSHRKQHSMKGKGQGRRESHSSFHSTPKQHIHSSVTVTAGLPLAVKQYTYNMIIKWRDFLKLTMWIYDWFTFLWRHSVVLG